MELTSTILSNLGFEPVDKETALQEMLDSEGPVNVASLEFWPSDIIKECDPVAWRCMLADMEDFEEVEGEDYLVDDCEDAREQLQALVDAVELAQEELDAALGDAEEGDALIIEELRSNLETANAELLEVQS